MAGEVISHVDFVIDADGFRKTEELLGTMDKYMERLRRRADSLSRLKIMPQIRLNDCLCVPLKQIQTKLKMLTGTLWKVSLIGEFNLDMSIVEDKGTAAGAAFTGKFLLAFDTNAIAQKLQASIDDVTANVSVSAAGASPVVADPASPKKDKAWWKPIADFGKDVGKDWLKDKGKKTLDLGADKLLGLLAGKKQVKEKNPVQAAAGWLKDAYFGGKKDSPAANCCCCDGKSGGGANGLDIQSLLLPEGNAKPRTILGPDGRPIKGGQTPVVKQSFGRRVLNASKNFMSKIGDGSKNMMGFSSPHPMGFNLAPKSAAFKIPNLGASSGLAKSAFKLGGKLFRPLGAVSDLMSIASAKPGQERNKAVGSALGGWGGAAAGAAIGTAIMPGVGTVIGGAIGGLAGSSVGEFVGDKLGKVSENIKNFFGFGHKKKKKEELVPPPAPISNMPTPSVAAQGTVQGALSSGRQANAGAVSINVNLPTGAVQLTVEDKLNYDEISALIGSKIATSIQQAMENRA